MGLIGNQDKDIPETKVDPSKKAPEEKSGRNKIVPVVIILLALVLLAGLVGGGYWAFVHRDELIERFFPPQSAEEVQGEDEPEEKPSFFRKLIKKDRTITVRGTLLGEEGGAAVLINKKVIPSGTLINGIRILEITNQSVVVEVDGLKRRLQVGESFNPDKE